MQSSWGGILNSTSDQVDALFENLSFDDQDIYNDLADKDNNMTDEVPICHPLHVKSRGLTNTPIVAPLAW